MRIVVTGASGNVGTALLRALAGRGHEVSGLSRRSPDLGAEPYRGVHWHVLDLADEGSRGRLARAVAGADAVVHTVWGFQPTRDYDYLERTGVGGTQAVLEACREAGVAHLVHLSSVGVYAPGAYGRRVDESWPTTGSADFSYGRHKAAAERLLDAHEATGGAPVVSRVRPGLVVQREAASGLMRYGTPGWFWPGLLRHVVLLPLDDRFVVPIVHADDLAAAIVAVVERRAAGAFNIATEPPLTRALLAEVLGARGIGVPHPVLHALASLSWRLRVQPLDPGWVDLAFAVPLLDTTRARRELDWRPRHDTREAVSDLVGGMVDRAAMPSPALRRRSIAGELSRSLRHGLVSSRRLP